MEQGFFGFLILGCGIYILYGYVMLKYKKVIKGSFLLSKNIDLKKCKDYRAYCKEVEPLLLLLGVVTTINGIIDLYNTFNSGWDVQYYVSLAIFVVVFVIYAVRIKHINEDYF